MLNTPILKYLQFGTFYYFLLVHLFILLLISIHIPEKGSVINQSSKIDLLPQCQLEDAYIKSPIGLPLSGGEP